MNRMMMTVGALLVAVAGLQAQQVTLKQDWTAGDYLWSLQAKQNVTVTLPDGQEMPAQTDDLRLVCQITVKGLPQDQRSFTFQVKEIRQEMQTPMGAMSYDSTAPTSQNPMLRREYEPLLNTAVEMIVGSDGKIVEIKGVDEINSQLQPFGLGSRVASALYSEDKLRELLKPSEFPASPVSVGQTWVTTQDVPMAELGQGKLQMQTTLQKIRQSPQGPLAVVKGEGTLKAVGGATEEGMPQEVTFQIQAATVHNLNRNLSQESKGRMKGKFEAGGPGQVATIDQETLITLTPGRYQPPAQTQPSQDKVPASQP
jgi:hypothetical protein